MMAQRYQGPDGTIYEEVPGGGYAVVSGGAQQPYTIGQADPAKAYEAPKAGVDLQNAGLSGKRTAQQIAMDAAKVTYAPRQAAADTTKSEAEAAAAQLALQKAQREASLPVAGQTGRANLQRAIDDIKAQFAAGPGRTSGVGGLLDYLPTSTNQRFNAAGNAVRGFVGPALGLTGGQLNTEKEAQRAVGPYIPQSGDYDSVIQDKIQRLQGLANAMAGAKAQQGRTQAQQQPIMAAPSISNAPPATPQGPAGYDVSSVAGGVSGGPGGAPGANFASAAGVTMAQKLSQAYNQGATIDQLNGLLTDNGFDPFSDPKAIEAIQKRGPLQFAPPTASDTRGGMGKALGSVADSAGGAYAISAGDALTAGTLDNIAGGQAKLAEDYAAKQYPGATLAGQVTGGALAAGGAELGVGALGARAGLSATSPWIARGADALYGGAYGAGSADDGSRLLGAAGGAAGGVTGGIAGRAAARGVGGLLTGVENADVSALRANQIPTTVGQTLGGTARRVENSLLSLPGVGDVIGNRYREGVSALRPAAVRQAVAEVPGNIDATSGREAIEQGRTAVGNAYDNALGGVNLTVDPAYRRELGTALQGANTLPGPLRDTFASTLQNRVAPQFNGPNIDGRGLQAAVQGLRKDSGSLISRNEVQSDLFADRATDVEEALFNLAERQAPGTPDALKAANRANRGLSIVEEASARAMNNGGDFSAAQLGQSIRQNSRRFNGMRALNSGKAPLQALQEAAQNVLPSVVPDSGTTGRAVVASGLGALGLGAAGGGTGYASGGEDGAGLGVGGGLALAGLLAAGGSKGGQRALTAALLNRTAADKIVGRAIKNRAGRAGIFGAPMLAGGGAYLAGLAGQ